ncbi:FAD-binding oxidoreductase [Actibacterium sp. 188UL27-1]|uniref:NAD(P)/FAD-dependent oxidoreductase n=1 Tax=Actibacterium sp. 188UL27-1 TaxID=2786961 RepID=UPI00195BC881|nr:FAD-dependent oxidoreductase [Actibacterium sp. 188UL27-1]MBM7067125.1 FAD-dependent oxidoreductase [Actibacterium sp. 188UL27-1]
MSHREKAGRTVAIIGAGIVGVSTAIWLLRDGFDVVLIDRAGPAGGASYGNGGVLAACSVVPVTAPGLLRKAPGMLLDPAAPLFVKWGYLPRLMPWLLRYLRHANARDATRIARALAPVIGDSLADHQALAAGTGADRFVVPSDYLFVYRDRAHFAGDAFAMGVRRNLGFVWDALEGADFAAYDPAFATELGFAARFGGHGRITDPGGYVRALADHAVGQGARLIRAEVTDVVRSGERVTGLRAGGAVIPCDDVVLATGAWSKPLAAKLGVNVPLESERGYHLDLWGASVLPRSPVMVAAGKFVATPMDGRLRLAGIVEFGGLDAEPSRPPFELLQSQIRAAMPGLTWDRAEKWMGHRPAPADSIPVIGAAPGVKNAWLGFGHHHVGLTGGPKTGRLLAQMIAGRRPNIDVAPYSPSRFAG